MSGNAHLLCLKCLKRTKMSKMQPSCSEVGDDINCPKCNEKKGF